MGNHLPPVTEWQEVTDEHQLAHALADVTATPFGHVGQNVGYIVRPLREMPRWDFADKMNLQWLLTHPYRRIKALYTMRDFGGPVAIITHEECDE